MATDKPGQTRVAPSGPIHHPELLAETSPFVAAPANASRDITHFAPASQAGDIGMLGPYRVVAELGRGGMGAVYRAWDTRLLREVAVKVMRPEFALDPVAQRRFLREARTAAQVNCDHVVPILEADQRDGIAYIVMPLLKGMPLDAFIEKKGFPTLKQTLHIARDMLVGLRAVHAKGLVHRDLKPSNIWLEAPAGRGKLLDFGLARSAAADDIPSDAATAADVPPLASQLSVAGQVVGAPAFMSPEQARSGTLDHRSDLFSFGTILYYLLAHELPFPATNAIDVMFQICTRNPLPLGQKRLEETPAALSELVMRLLAKMPADRPQSVQEVLDALKSVQVGDTSPGGDLVVSAALPAAKAASEASLPRVVAVRDLPSAILLEEEGPSPHDPPPTRKRKRRKKQSHSANSLQMIVIAGVLTLFGGLIGIVGMRVLNMRQESEKPEAPKSTKAIGSPPAPKFSAPPPVERAAETPPRFGEAPDAPADPVPFPTPVDPPPKRDDDDFGRKKEYPPPPKLPFFPGDKGKKGFPPPKKGF